MKGTIRRVLRWVRHWPLIEGADWFWSPARPWYERLLRVGSGGVTVRVGGRCDVLMPPEYASGAWDDYEPETVGALCDWVAAHPGGTVLDVGSSMGILSACVFATSPAARVIAFDSDLASLKATERLSSLVSGERLSLVFGYVADVHASGQDLRAALVSTREAIAESGVDGLPGTTKFVCVQDDAVGVPWNSLDGLFAAAPVSGPVLLKMDIEGAELVALRGGQRWLATARPDLLLSVHPPALAGRNESPAEIRQLLVGLDYDINVFAADHEEHWRCLARPVPAHLPA